MLMLFPLIMDLMIEGDNSSSNFVTEFNTAVLEKIFTQNVLLGISWISYAFIIWYVFKSFKNLRVEGLKFIILVIYNLFINLDLPAVQGTYYFWIIAIISIFILELFASRYAPINKNIIDTSEGEE